MALFASGTGLATASAQTWTTGYFNTRDGYGPANASLSGAPTNVSANFQWQTTDANEVNGMFFRTGWTFGVPNPGTNPITTSNKSTLYGGYNAASGPANWPSVTNVSLYRNFSNPVTLTSPAVVVSLDFGILPTASGLYTNKDIFGFEFLKGSSGSSLAKIALNPANATLTNGLRLQWQQNGTNVASDGVTFQAYELQYTALYRFTATIVGDSFDMSIFGLATQTNASSAITNYAVVSSNWVVKNGKLSESLDVTDFDQFALNWELSSGLTNAPGGNYMNLNTVSVATTVPEPSTIVLFAAGVAGLFVYRWRVRR